MEEEDDKPFMCTAPACGQKFTNEDHLAVHMRKHEMSLALNMGTGLTPGTGKSPISALMPGLFLDQTPTPTKFLKNCEEIGLFNELKNPFEEAFKKAMDTDSQTDMQTSIAAALPGPESNELNTPVPPIPRTVEDLASDKSQSCESSTKTDLSSLVLNRLKREKVSPGPSSTTDDVVIISSSPSKEKISKLVTSVLNIPSQMEAQSSAPSSRNVTLVTAAQSTTVSPPRSSEVQAPSITTQPQYSMQVFLQLPNGQTVPVQIPANTTGGLQVVQPSLMTSRTEQPVVNTATPSQALILPAQSPAPVQSQSNITKQKLKAAIQSQTIPSPISKQAPQTQISPGYTTIQISPGINPSVPPSSLQISPDATSYVPGIPNLSSVNALSPDSLDSIKSEMPSPEAADSTVNFKRLRSDDEGDDRRKKFLERNRAAAARCRQKRKNWITNLEKKGEDLQNTNGKLQSEVNVLRAEVAQLKTLLLAHKDCPVTLQQRSQGQIPLSLSTCIADQAVSVNQGTTSAPQVTDLTGATTSAPKELIESLTTAGLIPGAIVKTLDTGLITTQIVSQPAPVSQPTTITLNHPALTGNNQKIYTIIPKVIKTESPQLKK
ncbi:cyclic AMP-dependent transcription factor ATF-2-like isoform X2 [Ostrea edulis]|uniref:cyclic AMP-dependent transcription factor ATF-2-like isoform X2 n=1 Tax=Ostrea edulis TaxID=37623 RepID=UPI0024AEF86D|nr:cyclic AMP-dependent transcription factor ATF-2-like isoform X2 [Ostrea edulis]